MTVNTKEISDFFRDCKKNKIEEIPFDIAHGITVAGPIIHNGKYAQNVNYRQIQGNDIISLIGAINPEIIGNKNRKHFITAVEVKPGQHILFDQRTQRRIGEKGHYFTIKQ